MTDAQRLDKQRIADRLVAYRQTHGLGSFNAVADKCPDKLLTADLMRSWMVGARSIKYDQWRMIDRALNKLEEQKMNELRIVESYRNADNHEREIYEIAKANSCDVDRIIGVLEAHGEKVDKRKFPKKAKQGAKKVEQTAVQGLVVGETEPLGAPESKQLTLGRLRAVCAQLGDGVELTVSGVPLTGLCFMSEFDAADNRVRQVLELIGGEVQ